MKHVFAHGVGFTPAVRLAAAAVITAEHLKPTLSKRRYPPLFWGFMFPYTSEGILCVSNGFVFLQEGLLRVKKWDGPHKPVINILEAGMGLIGWTE